MARHDLDVEDPRVVTFAEDWDEILAQFNEWIRQEPRPQHLQQFIHEHPVLLPWDEITGNFVVTAMNSMIDIISDVCGMEVGQLHHDVMEYQQMLNDRERRIEELQDNITQLRVDLKLCRNDMMQREKLLMQLHEARLSSNETDSTVAHASSQPLTRSNYVRTEDVVPIVTNTLPPLPAVRSVKRAKKELTAGAGKKEPKPKKEK